jgi:chemotaxis protein MotB
MARKKHTEHVNHERWLVSYADLLTLLFAFFVVLFASSVSDKKKAAHMAVAMKTAFQSNDVFEAHAKTPPLTQDASASQGDPKPLQLPIQMRAAGIGDGPEKETTRKAIAASIEPAVQKHLITMHVFDEGITLSLNSAGFFASGSAEIKPATLPVLTHIAASLPQGMLRVEGHTDNRPIHTAKFRSNWELSTARAAAIAEVLMRESTVSPANFAIAGYGEFHPVAANVTEAGRAANRRVDIVLLSPKK